MDGPEMATLPGFDVQIFVPKAKLKEAEDRILKEPAPQSGESAARDREKKNREPESRATERDRVRERTSHTNGCAGSHRGGPTGLGSL